MCRLIKLANIMLVLLVMLGTAACGGSYTSKGSSSSPGSSAPAPRSESGSEPAQADPLPTPPPYQSSLTAGQVDDNALFNEYLGYLQSYQGSDVHKVDVSRRFYVRVVDGDKHPVAGARVQLFDGQQQVFDGRTLSDGRVLFFPNEADAGQTQSFTALVSRGQVEPVDALFIQGEKAQLPDITLPIKDNTGPVGVDLVFLLDATGSMGDEIDKIKDTVGAIASRIEQLPGSSKPRLGLVAYRDRGDDYVTRRWDFTDSIGQFSANLSQVEAAGGGDTPESVSAGLSEALALPGWADASSGRHVRMIVLVGDAAPHIDYADDPEYTGLLQQAVAQGIKIFPIGASDLNEQGEYIFRQFAQVTQGQFVFLTYANGVSGSPGRATTNDVANFTVQNLDNLVVNLVAGEVANQTGQPSGNAGNNPAALATIADAEPAASNPPISPEPTIGSRMPMYLGFALMMSVGVVLMIVSIVTYMGWIFWLGVPILLLVLAVRRASRVASEKEAPTALPTNDFAYLSERYILSHEMPTLPLRLPGTQQARTAYAPAWTSEQVVQSDGQQTLPLNPPPINRVRIG